MTGIVSGGARRRERKKAFFTACLAVIGSGGAVPGDVPGVGWVVIGFGREDHPCGRYRRALCLCKSDDVVWPPA